MSVGDLSDRQSILRAALFVCAYGFIAGLCGLFLYCLWFRVFYPFELDWIEGEIMCHVVRLLEGKSMYPPPSMEFVAEMYPPVYYFFAALSSKIFGIGMPAGRVVSLAACLAVVFMLYRTVARETGRKSLAGIGAGLFIGLYHVHGPWYDLARVDMLFFAFLYTACFMLAYYAERPWGMPLAAAAMVLACYTKQNGLVYLGAMALYLFARDRKRGLIFAIATGVVICAVFVLYTTATNGWFGTYTFFNLLGYKNNLAASLPTSYHQIIQDIKEKLPVEIRYELCYKLPILSVMLLAYLVGSLLFRRRLKGAPLWEYMAAAGIVTYFLVRPHPGSEKNDLIHVTLWSCVLIPAGIHAIGRLPDRFVAHRAQCAALALVCVQCCLLVYDPRTDIPAPGSRERGMEFIATLRAMEGEVYIPYHSFYGYLAGKRMLFNAGAFWGLQLLNPEAYKPDDMIQMINRKCFSAIVIDETSYYTWLGQRVPFDNVSLLLKAGEPLSAAIEKNYGFAGRIPYRHVDEFRNPTGFMTRPEIILVPKH